MNTPQLATGRAATAEYGTVYIHPVHPNNVNPRPSAIRRFCGAFAVAVLILAAINFLLEGVFDDVSRPNNIHWVGNFPVPEHVAVVRCLSPTDWSVELPSSFPGYTYTSVASFQLPIDSDTLFFLSRGPAYGRVHVTSSENVTSHAIVRVTASYKRSSVRDVGSEICMIKRAENEVGVGIFTRKWYGFKSAQWDLHYHAEITLPASGVAGPLQINNFETDVPNTAHTFSEFRGDVKFLNVSLKGSNAPIEIPSLTAQRANIRTSNGHIKGVFKSSKSLLLKTSNAHIVTNVSIINDDSYVSQLDMHTTNGHIEAQATLLSPSERGGKYFATAFTSNSPLKLDFQNSPLESTLRLQATTSNSPATVSLPPTYQGTFSMDTSHFSSSVEDQEVEDPSGKGRHRTIDIWNHGQQHLNGCVFWSADEAQGSVSIATSNSPAILKL